MKAPTVHVTLALAALAQVHCIQVGGGQTQASNAVNMISVSDKLFSCIEGPQDKFEAAASWTKDSAKVYKEGTCKAHWDLKEEIPTVADKDIFKQFPCCTALGRNEGLRQCFLNQTDLLKHLLMVKRAR